MIPEFTSEFVRAQLAILVARYGWRFTSRAIRAAGISERVVHAACCAGLARCTTVHTGDSIYLVFA